MIMYGFMWICAPTLQITMVMSVASGQWGGGGGYPDHDLDLP
jgi:hypothetical protein